MIIGLRALHERNKVTYTVGYVENFQIGGGCKSAIFHKLKFDIVPYFGLINCPTVAKIFSCKNGFLSLICIILTRATALKTSSLDFFIIISIQLNCLFQV